MTSLFDQTERLQLFLFEFVTLHGTQLAVPDSPIVTHLRHSYCANSNAQKVPSYFCIIDRTCVSTTTFPRLLSRYL